MPTPWQVTLASQPVRALKRLRRAGQRALVARIQAGLEALAEDPVRARPGVDIRRLKGFGTGAFRLRVGSWRVLYTVEPEERHVLVTVVAHRRRAYR